MKQRSADKKTRKYRADTILVFSTTTYKHALPINLQLRKKNQCAIYIQKNKNFLVKVQKKEELVLTAIINNINAMNFVHIPHNNCSI